jgi:hypothetical protein
MVTIASVNFSYAPSGNNVTTGVWVQLQPVDGAGVSLSGASPAYSMPAECVALDAFDSSGATMELGIGTVSGSVKHIAFLPPGGFSDQMKIGISKGMCMWIRSTDITATGGSFVANLYHGRK